jgi:hypothetical protein
LKVLSAGTRQKAATFVRATQVICDFLKLRRIMVDDTLGFQGTGVVVRLIQPAVFLRLNQLL